MSKDFKISSSLHLYDKFNIAWIKKESNANQFALQKAPFLASVLVSLEVSDGQSQKSVTVTLKDMTGKFQQFILHFLLYINTIFQVLFRETSFTVFMKNFQATSLWVQF